MQTTATSNTEHTHTAAARRQNGLALIAAKRARHEPELGRFDGLRLTRVWADGVGCGLGEEWVFVTFIHIYDELFFEIEIINDTQSSTNWGSIVYNGFMLANCLY